MLTTQVLHYPVVNGSGLCGSVAQVVPSQSVPCGNRRGSTHLALPLKLGNLVSQLHDLGKDVHRFARLHERPVLNVLRLPEHNYAMAEILSDSNQPSCRPD